MADADEARTRAPARWPADADDALTTWRPGDAEVQLARRKPFARPSGGLFCP